MDSVKNTTQGNRFDAFRKLVDSCFAGETGGMVKNALEIADRKLAGLTRYDGTPLVDHSVNAAKILISEIGLGSNSTISTLLHDAVRLGMLAPEEAGAQFGGDCALILKALCNISDVNVKVDDTQTDNFRDLIVSYSTDPRVILIKLADRLEVMRALAMFPPRKRTRKSWESLNLYAQIAHKLGLYPIKSELEDLSLRWLEPAGYEYISERLRETASERETFIADFLKPIEAKLKASGIEYTVKSRTKSIYSIWRKIRGTGLPFEEIYDIFALRIIIDCPPEQEKQHCWNVYSIVSDFYTPNPERLRDWISIPKSNGYESLHTTVVTKDGRWVEIQIRSERMDAVAERGIAAHWRYKGVHQGGMGSEQWLAKLRELMEHQDPVMERKLGMETTTGEIFVFTPLGDLKKLREGATLLDFAYEIHTGLGATCTGGKVNRRNATIRDVLHNGDIVEIHTSKLQKPKADWLNIVRTTRARSKIRTYLREEQAKAARLGKEEFERRIKNWKFQITIDEAVTVLSKYYRIKTGVEFYSRIADGRIDIGEVKELLVRHIAGEQLVEAKIPRAKPQRNTEQAKDDSLVIDESIRNLEYKFAKCCNPIRGDEIFGFVTVNAGITIHRTGCPNAKRLREQYPYRVLDAKWREAQTQGMFRATIRVTTENAAGIVNKITEVITRQMKVDIRSMNMAPNPKGEMTGIINIEVDSTKLVDAVIYNIMRVKGVLRANRVNN